jgi:hypothetical protein
LKNVEKENADEELMGRQQDCHQKSKKNAQKRD